MNAAFGVKGFVARNSALLRAAVFHFDAAIVEGRTGLTGWIDWEHLVGNSTVEEWRRSGEVWKSRLVS